MEPAGLPIDDVRRILKLVDDKAGQFVAFLRDLVRVPSVWGDGPALTDAAETLAHALRASGVPVDLADCGTPGMSNVVASLGPPTDDGLVFNGHLEVYPPSASWSRDPFGGDLEDGRVYGVGVADMKAGTAAMTMAVVALAQAGVVPSRRITVLAVPNHFEGGEGTRHALRNGLRARYAINGEPSGLHVLTGQRGIAYVNVAVHGRSAHTTALDIGVNAIDRASRVVDAVRQMPVTGQDGQVIPAEKVCNVAEISGGIAHNLVPERCDITFDVRFPPEQTQECVLRDIRAAVAGALPALDDFPVDVRLEDTCLRNPRSSLRVPRGASILGTLRRAHQRATGSTPASSTHRAWPDTPIFWEAGVEAATYGPGSMDCYWDDEFVPVEEYLTAIKTYALAALEIAG